jgi:ribosome-binding factor A
VARTEKVAQAIKKEIGKIVHDELSDPRLGFVTIMRVDITKDLRIAKVYFSVMGSPEQKDKVKEAIESASGHIRRLIGERLRLRFVPEIIFRQDDSVEYSFDMAKKIERIKDELKKGPCLDKEE